MTSTNENQDKNSEMKTVRVEEKSLNRSAVKIPQGFGIINDGFSNYNRKGGTDLAFAYSTVLNDTKVIEF